MPSRLRIGVNALYLIPGGVGGTEIYLRNLLIALSEIDRRSEYFVYVNRETGVMTPAGIFEMGTSPSSVALNAAGTRLYSSNETDFVGDDKQGTVSAFSIDPENGNLKIRQGKACHEARYCI